MTCACKSPMQEICAPAARHFAAGVERAEQQQAFQLGVQREHLGMGAARPAQRALVTPPGLGWFRRCRHVPATRQTWVNVVGSCRQDEPHPRAAPEGRCAAGVAGEIQSVLRSSSDVAFEYARRPQHGLWAKPNTCWKACMPRSKSVRVHWRRRVRDIVLPAHIDLTCAAPLRSRIVHAAHHRTSLAADVRTGSSTPYIRGLYAVMLDD